MSSTSSSAAPSAAAPCLTVDETRAHRERAVAHVGSLHRALAAGCGSAGCCASWRPGPHASHAASVAVRRTRSTILGRQLQLQLIARTGTPIVQLKDGNILELSLPSARTAACARGGGQVVPAARCELTSRRACSTTARGSPCQAPRVFLSNAQTRWGSCNAQREVRLNWRLMQAAQPHPRLRRCARGGAPGGDEPLVAFLEGRGEAASGVRIRSHRARRDGAPFRWKP